MYPTSYTYFLNSPTIYMSYLKHYFSNTTSCWKNFSPLLVRPRYSAGRDRVHPRVEMATHSVFLPRKSHGQKIRRLLSIGHKRTWRDDQTIINSYNKAQSFLAWYCSICFHPHLLLTLSRLQLNFCLQLKTWNWDYFTHILSSLTWILCKFLIWRIALLIIYSICLFLRILWLLPYHLIFLLSATYGIIIVIWTIDCWLQ